MKGEGEGQAGVGVPVWGRCSRPQERAQNTPAQTARPVPALGSQRHRFPPTGAGVLAAMADSKAEGEPGTLTVSEGKSAAHKNVRMTQEQAGRIWDS